MGAFGKNVKKLRKAKGLTQEQLADALGVSRPAVTQWENGGSPKLRHIDAVARYFGVSAPLLLGHPDYTNDGHSDDWDDYSMDLDSMETELIEKFRCLPLEVQSDVMDYVDFQLSKNKEEVPDNSVSEIA